MMYNPRYSKAPKTWASRTDQGFTAMAPDGEKESGPPAASEALVEAIRALVREELQKPLSPTIPKQPPTWQDVVWLLVLVLNVVLFVALIPERWLKDPALAMVGKVLPWLGGGTFVLGTTWFQDRLLALSRSRRFKIVMASVMAPLVLLQVRFIPLRPQIEPADSHFYVDGRLQEGYFHGDARIWVRLAGHKFEIAPYNKGGSATGRTIEWGWPKVVKASMWSHQPKSGLIYPVTITSDGKGCKVHIRTLNAKEQFDTDFFDERLKPTQDSLEFEPKFNSDEVKLPFGTYEVSLEKAGCQTIRYPGSVEVPLNGSLDFGNMKCKGN